MMVLVSDVQRLENCRSYGDEKRDGRLSGRRLRGGFGVMVDKNEMVDRFWKAEGEGCFILFLLRVDVALGFCWFLLLLR